MGYKYDVTHRSFEDHKDWKLAAMKFDDLAFRFITTFTFADLLTVMILNTKHVQLQLH